MGFIEHPLLLLLYVSKETLWYSKVLLVSSTAVYSTKNGGDLDDRKHP
jgi:hypothetical protein